MYIESVHMHMYTCTCTCICTCALCFSATPGEVSSELSGDGTGPATEAESGAVPAAAGREGQAVIM